MSAHPSGLAIMNNHATRAWSSPKFPPSRLVDAFDQVVEPLITEITCLRSQEPTLFHLVKAYVGSPPRGNYGLDKR